MKKNICIVCALALMLCGLCACSQTPEQRAMSIAKEKLGLDLSGKCTVEELYYTYDDGNIFGEGTAEYRLSFDGDSSGLFSSLDTLPRHKRKRRREKSGRHGRHLSARDQRRHAVCLHKQK